MSGEKKLNILINELSPHLNEGEYVFSSVKDVSNIERADTVCEFKESEGITIVIERTKADALNLQYNLVASWITCNIHSSLDAIGLTSLISTELARHNISCNIIAGFYHDHIFVGVRQRDKALKVLKLLANGK